MIQASVSSLHFTPVWVEVDSPDIAVLALSDDHIVCDGYQGIHAIWVAGKLVGVQAILVLAEENLF